jgi:hypothetical protein
MFRLTRSSSVKQALKAVGISLLTVVTIGTALSPLVHAVPAPGQSTWAHEGVSIRARTPTDFGSGNMAQTLLNLKSTNANEVLLVVPFYQANVSACTFYSGVDTPTLASVASATAMAHQDGLNVILKFHPELADGTWRAYINATDRQCWFKNSAAEELSYLQSSGADGAIVGTEEHNMFGSIANPTNAANVKTFMATIRAGFKGTLSYDAQEDGAWNDLTDVDWSLFDYGGISCYWNLGTNLATSWNAIGTNVLDPLHAKFPNTQFTCGEIGYRSVANAHTAPWSYGMTGAADNTEQANDYQALFDFMRTRPYMSGVDFWYWSVDPGAWDLGPTEFTSQNKPAQQVMTTNFTVPNPANPVTPVTPVTPTPPPAQQTPIDAYYAKVKTLLGAPTGAETAIKGGTVRTYKNGNIYWSAATGAHEIDGPILARYLVMGGPTTVGFPTSDITGTTGVAGSYASFAPDHRIYWSSATGAHEIHGLMLAKYLSLGGPAGYGLPVNDQPHSTVDNGQYSNFTGGRSIYWSAATGAHAIYGVIRARWMSVGAEHSILGYPTTDEFSWSAGRQNLFQHGHRITWTARTGATTIY